MYVIEKRRIPDGELSVPLSVEPVQRIFITRDFRKFGPAPITYYDTQIKYGVRYQYDVRIINIVLGTQYQYTNISLQFPHTTVENVPLESRGRALGNALGFYSEENPMVTSIGDYLLGGELGWERAQHNHLKLANEEDLLSQDPAQASPSMYFEDGENVNTLGWPATPYQTDVGKDPGWDKANIGGPASEKGGSGKPVGQSGYYVFGGPEDSIVGGPADGRPGFAEWIQDFSTFYRNAPALANFDLKTHIPVDDYGGPIAAPQPGGMYIPSTRDNILSRLTVKVVDGMGHDGNATGGLIPWEVNMPQTPGPDTITVQTDISICEWLTLYQIELAHAFRDWYTTSLEFFDIGPAQNCPGMLAGPIEWARTGRTYTKPNGTTWNESSFPHGLGYRNRQRWYAGDSYMLQEPLPAEYDNMVTDQSNWPSYVVNSPVSTNGAQGRNLCSWYAPNWTNNTHINDHGFWHPHSHNQIVYWLLHGADGFWQSTVDHGYYGDPTDATEFPNGGDLHRRSYVHPKSNLGRAHGRDILWEFGQWWNSNYANYGGALPSKSPLGVFVNPAQTTHDAILADHGNSWSRTQWLNMLEMLYDPACLGNNAWPQPSLGMSGQGAGGPGQ